MVLKVIEQDNFVALVLIRASYLLEFYRLNQLYAPQTFEAFPY